MLGLIARVVIAAALSLAGFAAGHGRVNGPRQPDDNIQIQPQTLYRGCDDIVVNAPVGTPWGALLARVADPSVVVGIWKLDNAAQRYRAQYFANTVAPLDGTPATAEQVQGVWFCVSAQSSIS